MPETTTEPTALADLAARWKRQSVEYLSDWQDYDSHDGQERRGQGIALGDAASELRAALARDVPAGRDLTAQDVRRAPAEHGAAGVADYLNRIARPAGGVGQPDAAEPRSWSLPAPPPDDVTVVHVGNRRFERLRNGVWWDGRYRESSRSWHELLREGTVVEGEPPAPECTGDSECAATRHVHGCFAEQPRFKRGFYRLARDLSVKFAGSYRGVRLVAVSDQEGDAVTVWTPGHGEAEVSAAALAAAGAERVEAR